MPRVHAIQLDTVWQNPAASRERARALIASASAGPGDWIVLPEMFDVGFTMNVDAATADSAGTNAFLVETARQHRAFLVAGVARRDASGRAFNAAMVVDPNGSTLGVYDKCQGFSPAGECEKYVAGTSPILLDLQGMSASVLVCYDLRFPELFRHKTNRSAEVFFVIANWPSPRVEHWVTLARARAIENLAYVVAVNRCGSDPHVAYPGQSIIVDPKGNVIAHADAREQVLTASLGIDLVRDWRRDFPALRDARFW